MKKNLILLFIVAGLAVRLSAVSAEDDLEGFGSFDRKKPKESPTATPTPSPLPSPLPSPIPEGQESDSASDSVHEGRPRGALLGSILGGILSGLSGPDGMGGQGLPGAGAGGGFGGSGPQSPYAGGITQDSEVGQLFDPKRNRNVLDKDGKEREAEKEVCTECPAEDPGIKGDPNTVGIDKNTQIFSLESDDLSAQGARDIANAVGAPPPIILKTPQQVQSVMFNASADASGGKVALFLNDHGGRNGWLKTGGASQDLAQNWIKGGGKNPNVVIIHSECFAGAHASIIAEELRKAGFSETQRPNQFYARPAGCGVQYHSGGYSMLDSALYQKARDGSLTLGEMSEAAQSRSVLDPSGKPYVVHIRREAVRRGGDSK